MACIEGIGRVRAPMSGKDDELHLTCARSPVAPDPARPPSQPPEIASPTPD
jgi:hypothetical protein